MCIFSIALYSFGEKNCRNLFNISAVNSEGERRPNHCNRNPDAHEGQWRPREAPGLLSVLHLLRTCSPRLFLEAVHSALWLSLHFLPILSWAAVPIPAKITATTTTNPRGSFRQKHYFFKDASILVVEQSKFLWSNRHQGLTGPWIKEPRKSNQSYPMQ